MSYLPIQSQSIFQAVTWPFIDGPLEGSAVSMPSTIKPVTTSIFAAGTADRSLPHARWHAVRSALIHGSGFHRTEIRYGARTAAGDAPGFRPATGARLVALFHMVAFQTYAGKCDSRARTFARAHVFWAESESPRLLERRRQRSSLLAWRHFPV